MGNQKRVERVAGMEARMDQVLAAADTLEQALRQWEAAQEELAALKAYYESPQWRRDYEADEAGKLPAELKRGVLSQDGVWDLLERVRDLRQEMARLAGPKEDREE